MRANGAPPKDPARRARRNAPTIGTTVLPSEGRSGRAPKWPLGSDAFATAQLQLARVKVREIRKQLKLATRAADIERLQRRLDEAVIHADAKARVLRQRSAREKALWAELWKTPQAVMWERLHTYRAVASYVQAQVAGELGDAKAAKEARLREADLGLTPRGLQALRWSIAPSGTPAAKAPVPQQPAPAAGARARRGAFLQAVPNLPSATGPGSAAGGDGA